MDKSVCFMLAAALLGSTNSQHTARFGDKFSQVACSAQYAEMFDVVSKISKSVNRIDKTLVTQSGNVTKGQSQYQVFYTRKQWIDADLSCFKLGGHLVSFENMEELTHVSSLLTKNCATRLGFWTAGRDFGSNHWIWRDNGDAIKQDLWHVSQPNNNGDCGHLWTEHLPYRFADFGCSRELCYICEI